MNVELGPPQPVLLPGALCSAAQMAVALSVLCFLGHLTDALDLLERVLPP